MKEAITLEISGLKCDNPTCNYKDMTIDVKDYEQYIDSPCPKCEANLLTKKDCKETQRMLKMVKVLNKIFPKRQDDSADNSMKVNMNGTGKVEFEQPIKVEK